MTISRCWYVLLAVVIVGALTIQLVLLFNGGVDANSGQFTAGTGVGLRLWRLFSYFTIESNLFVLATALILAVRPDHDGRVWRVVRLDALLGIVITGLVFALVLAPQVHLTGAALVATIGFHYISPWAALAGWLLFGPRSRVNWGTVAAAFIWPITWLVYIFVQGAFTGWYPYPFLDVTRIGAGAAVRNGSFVLALGILLALGFKMTDARMPVVVRATRAGSE